MDAPDLLGAGNGGAVLAFAERLASTAGFTEKKRKEGGCRSVIPNSDTRCRSSNSFPPPATHRVLARLRQSQPTPPTRGQAVISAPGIWAERPQTTAAAWP